MDNSLKGLALAAGTVITCIVLSVGFYFLRESKAISASSAGKLNEFSSELTESDLSMYDGLSVSGIDVVNLIKKELGGYESNKTAPLYVYVKTSKTENTYRNGGSIDLIKNFANERYINPIGKFTSSVVKDENEVIVGVNFVQN